MVRLAVVGSRTFINYNLMCRSIEELKLKLPGEISKIVTGCCKTGADSLSIRYATEYHLPVHVYYAEWKQYGKRAGALRNQKIVDNCDHLIAFWDGVSPGTRITINMAIEKGLAHTVIKY